jgi:hypothetical protein
MTRKADRRVHWHLIDIGGFDGDGDALGDCLGKLLSFQNLAVCIQRVAVSVEAADIDQVPMYAPISFAGHEAGDFFFVPIR